MIIITTNYRRKEYQYRYEGEIEIAFHEVSLSIHWYIDELPPTNDEELSTWCSNGFDMFMLEDIVSIRGE